MSVKVMGLVWDLKISREGKFILLAYADHADHEGGSIFPAISTIAEKTGYSKRSVQRITRLLEESGHLVAVSGQKGGVGITAHWCIPMKDDKIAPLPKGDNNGSGRVTETTPKGDTAMSPDPSLTTINLKDNINKLGGGGFYIFKLVGFDYKDADNGTKKAISALFRKHGEYRICQLAADIASGYPDMVLPALLKQLKHNAELLPITPLEEQEGDYY